MLCFTKQFFIQYLIMWKVTLALYGQFDWISTVYMYVAVYCAWLGNTELCSWCHFLKLFHIYPASNDKSRCIVHPSAHTFITLRKVILLGTLSSQYSFWEGWWFPIAPFPGSTHCSLGVGGSHIPRPLPLLHKEGEGLVRNVTCFMSPVESR